MISLKFYINEIKTSDAYNYRKIGLFTDNSWTGTGNIFGEFKTDYYRSTTLLAFGIQENAKQDDYNCRRVFDGGVFVTERIADVSVQITDRATEMYFEAEDEDAAINIFTQQLY